MWYSFPLALILIIAIFAVGCVDETPEPVSQAWGPTTPGQVLYQIGDVTGGGQVGERMVSGTIDTITFTVGLVPGESPINMENLSIVYADAIRTETLIPVLGFRGDPPEGAWGILAVNDEVGMPNNRLEYEEKFVIRINPKAPLVPRQLITISVKPQSGNALTIRRVSPATIGREVNILTPM